FWGASFGRVLRPRHPAGGIIGPVAVEADHAPLDAPADAEPAAGLVDRIADLMARAVGDVRDAAAEPSRERLCGPRPPGHLANPLDPDDLEIRIPVHALLL